MPSAHLARLQRFLFAGGTAAVKVAYGRRAVATLDEGASMGKVSEERTELTTRGVKSFDPLRAEVTWDARLPGFGLRTRRSADASRWRWVYSYRLGGRGGEQVKLSRPFRELTPEQARQWAEAERGRKGTPIGQRERAAAAKARLQEERLTPNGDRLWDEYWAAEGRMKRAGRNYRQLWTCHLAPQFAARKVRDVGPADVERFKASMTALPGACNRALALLSRMFSLAVLWGYRAGCAPEHPVKGVTRYPERPSEFYFTEAELGRILRAADSDDNRAGGLALRMLALTGARASEVTRAHWGQFEFEPEGAGGGAFWTVSNTKIGRPVTRRLNPDLARRLQEWKPIALGMQTGNDVIAMNRSHRWWVFPQQPDPTRPMARLQHVWQRVRTAAGVREGRIHDLRHTAATLAMKATGSLTAVQAQLGHATMLTTRRYAHLMREGMVEMGDLLGQLGERAQLKAEAEESAAIVAFHMQKRGREARA